MQLTLGRSRTNCTPTDQVRDVLRADRIEQFRADGDAEMCEVAKELTGDTQTFVDVEGSVEVGVVDETLPADCCSGFLWVTVMGLVNNSQVVIYD